MRQDRSGGVRIEITHGPTLRSTRLAAPTHGYAGARSGGTFDLPEGTVYPALHRLERAGLLTNSWADAEGRRRRVYAMTADGEAALAAERT